MKYLTAALTAITLALISHYCFNEPAFTLFQLWVVIAIILATYELHEIKGKLV